MSLTFIYKCKIIIQIKWDQLEEIKYHSHRYTYFVVFHVNNIEDIEIYISD